MEVTNTHEGELIEMVKSSKSFMSALTAVKSLELNSWCIGAGAVRALVWDCLHGFSSPSAIPDVDVAYFDPTDLTPKAEQALLSILRGLQPNIPWEVTNQAAVHLWFEGAFGHPVQPLTSLHEAIASWPEFATSVGITLNEKSQLKIIAPFGLNDLFAMVVRRNPARVCQKTYLQRIEQKKYSIRWPKVQIQTD